MLEVTSNRWSRNTPEISFSLCRINHSS